jgi:putative membrane protein
MFYFMGFGFFFMTLFWIGIIVLIVWIINNNSFIETKKRVHIKPLDIIKTRYAKGEINKKEFHEMQKELQV